MTKRNYGLRARTWSQQPVTSKLELWLWIAGLILAAAPSLALASLFLWD